jgi:hypothetical protein
LLLTIYGFVLASMPGAWDWFAKHRRWSLALGITVLSGGLALIEVGVIQRDTAVDSVFANIFTWTWLLGISRLRSPAPELQQPPAHLGARCRLSDLHPSPDRDHHDRVQGDSAAVGPVLKYWVVLGATLLSCVLLYEFLLRRFALTRLAFGIKTHATEVRPPFQEMRNVPISAECGNRPPRAQ